MKKGGIIILLVLVFGGCENPDNNCSTPATVRNLTGIDGCGWVFELEDGTRLEPIGVVCTMGLNQKCKFDSLGDFEFVDGKRVFINYEINENMGSYCMVGPIVNITCIREVASIVTE